MITAQNGIYKLDTDNTSYIFRECESGHLQHLYYGRKIHADAQVLCEKHVSIPGNTNIYSPDFNNFSLEDMCLEMSSWGKGDIREPFIEVSHADGSSTSDFLFESSKITLGKEESETLPGSYDEDGNVGHLTVILKDSNYNLKLELHYYVYEKCNVITRSAKFINESTDDVRLNRLMSMQLDFNDSDYELSSFNGAWIREMNRNIISLEAGKYVNESVTGTSSNRSNPFVMIARHNTSENFGECFGFNLIYSGNHYEAAQVNSYGKLRIVTGINPSLFSYKIRAGESFETPEAVMTYGYAGFNSMSHNMHDFVNNHIVRGKWKNRVRPILLNSWEAAYFNINEKKLLRLAKAGKEAGVELFVMDDGWFGERNDDTSSLGDWTPNEKKLPGGIREIADKIKALGLDFGIWVEPEMVNVKSRLYEKHPEWVVDIPEKPHSEGRNQRILDLSNTEVQDYIIEQMSNIFSSADISYVKWDMNRIFSDYYSKNLPPERQGEMAHRYVCGLYHCMRELTKRFPDILFEGCSAGGNRFDLGILCYFPQIWASDNTDALCRTQIQYNYSYGYPLSCISAHVSASPNHQTLRNMPLETRFAVAAFGNLGYEFNLCDLPKDEFMAVKAQIELYKKWREVIQYGTFYRRECFDNRNSRNHGVLNNGAGNNASWCVASKDMSKAVGFTMQKLVVPNTQFACFFANGLKDDTLYHFYNRRLKHNIKEFGELVNMVSPVHIKQGSLVQELASKFVKLDGETEDYTAYGDTLMYAGVKLKQSFSATGYSEDVRLYQDFAARLYFMEEVNADDNA